MAGLHETTQPSVRPVQVEDDVLIRPPTTQGPSMVDVFHRSTVDCLKPQRRNWCAGYAAPKPQLVSSFQMVISSQITEFLT
jgi:hypothetical protein